MTYEQYRELFAKDENDCFINLIIPAQGSDKELNLIGKKPEEFTLDEIIRMKKYSTEMYETIKSNK